MDTPYFVPGTMQRVARAPDPQPEPDGCLLDDLHGDLHRGEKCPECGYDPYAETREDHEDRLADARRKGEA